LNGDDQEDTGTERSSSSSKNENKETKAYSDIDDAFADLMED